MLGEHDDPLSDDEVRRLRQRDLDLLPVLVVLLEERNVSRTAERLGLSQSGVSRALQRLRESLRDPLVIRTATGVMPTRRAELLLPSAKRLLRQLERLWQPHELDILRLERCFRVVAEDFFETTVLPGLVRRLGELAPGVTVQILPHGPDACEQIERGRAELWVHRSMPEGAGWFTQVLFWDQMACVVAAGHPVSEAGFDVEHFCALHHVVVDLGGGRTTTLDRMLAEQGRSRRVMARVRSFGAIPALVTGVPNAVASVPRTLATLWARSWGVELRSPGFVLDRFALRQSWYAADDADPAHRWFRQLLAAVSGELEREDQVVPGHRS